MVKRMRGVEAGHVKREDALQREVDSATRAVFQQHVALARADRLAALGEMSARVAHELRNPLSGVLMALINLAEETQDPEQRERLQLAVRELERVGRLLSGLVEDAKQMPESPRQLRLATLLDELFGCCAISCRKRSHWPTWFRRTWSASCLRPACARR